MSTKPTIYNFGVYVTNYANPNPTPSIVAKVVKMGDANIIAFALTKAVITSPLTYSVKPLCNSRVMAKQK